MSDTQRTGHRFDGVFSNSVERAIWDNPIIETPDFVVVPSKGSLIPGWLLVVPRRPAINFAEVSRSHIVSPGELASSLAKRLRAACYVWFEHGAAESGTEVSCRVDYAHLHLLINPPFDLAALVNKCGGEHWSSVTAYAAYEGLNGQTPYYVCGDATHAYFDAGRPRQSQYFRRAVAELVERPNLWDYREYVGEQEARITLDRYHINLAAAE